MLRQDLFYSRRQFELRYVWASCLTKLIRTSQLPWYMGYMAENARRFFHPAVIEDMLSLFLPQIDTNLLDVGRRCRYLHP